MSDREKVAEGLEYLITAYAFHCDDAQCLGDAIELLKEQKTRWNKISPAGIYECEKCGQNVMTGDIEAYRYCHGCGRAVKWDD